MPQPGCISLDKDLILYSVLRPCLLTPDLVRLVEDPREAHSVIGALGLKAHFLGAAENSSLHALRMEKRIHIAFVFLMGCLLSMWFYHRRVSPPFLAHNEVPALLRTFSQTALSQPTFILQGQGLDKQVIASRIPYSCVTLHSCCRTVKPPLWEAKAALHPASLLSTVSLEKMCGE